MLYIYPFYILLIFFIVFIRSLDSLVVTSFSPRKEEINRLTMTCAITSDVLREAPYHRKSHYYNNNNSVQLTSYAMMSMLDIFIWKCAIPFKSSRICSVKSTDVEKKNNKSNRRRCNDRPGFECAICLRNVDNLQISAFKCGHWFCSDCTQLCIAQLKSCPQCNMPVTPNSSIRIFLP